MQVLRQLGPDLAEANLERSIEEVGSMKTAFESFPCDAAGRINLDTLTNHMMSSPQQFSHEEVRLRLCFIALQLNLLSLSVCS